MAVRDSPPRDVHLCENWGDPGARTVFTEIAVGLESRQISFQF